jgi:hypothetical protein
MSDSALSVRYQKFRYQAQSDIADHGYQTKCPSMILEHVEVMSSRSVKADPRNIVQFYISQAPRNS